VSAHVVDVFRATVAEHGDRVAFVDGDRHLTYAEWERNAGGVAAAFAAAGVGPGDVVCVQLPSSVEYAMCYQAALQLGAITSGINPRLGPAEVEHIVGRTEPKLIVRTLEDVRAWAAQRPWTGSVALDPSAPVAIVWTSGTTGKPKGAVYDSTRLEAMAAAAGVLSERFDRRLSPLPFSHIGFMTRVWDELVNVMTTVITPTPWKAVDALRLIEQERVTVGQGVPAQWSLILRAPELTDTDTSSLRIVSSGAAPVPAELVRALRDTFHVPVVIRYTSTEACVTTGTRIGDPDDVIVETVGRAGEGVEVIVADDDGRPVATGEVGVVRVRSGAVMKGYWKDPEATAAVIDGEGWLTTGDLGFLGPDGNLRLVGRRSEMYIRGGYNVYPAEVEDALASHPGVDRAAVVGAPDPVLGEIGVAFIVPARDAPLDAPPLDIAEVRAFCRSRLADYKAPDRVVVVDDLPLTSMSKVDKRALLEAV
jgi:acyl-CoA synthetase (AMP-forming)/AMP-acid ligase II